MSRIDTEWNGVPGSYCQHRTVGPHRAWCHTCSEWCYPDAPCGESSGCYDAAQHHTAGDGAAVTDTDPRIEAVARALAADDKNPAFDGDGAGWLKAREQYRSHARAAVDAVDAVDASRRETAEQIAADHEHLADRYEAEAAKHPIGITWYARERAHWHRQAATRAREIGERK